MLHLILFSVNYPVEEEQLRLPQRKDQACIMYQEP